MLHECGLLSVLGKDSHGCDSKGKFPWLKKGLFVEVVNAPYQLRTVLFCIWETEVKVSHAVCKTVIMFRKPQRVNRGSQLFFSFTFSLKLPKGNWKSDLNIFFLSSFVFFDLHLIPDPASFEFLYCNSLCHQVQGCPKWVRRRCLDLYWIVLCVLFSTLEILLSEHDWVWKLLWASLTWTLWHLQEIFRMGQSCIVVLLWYTPQLQEVTKGQWDSFVAQRKQHLPQFHYCRNNMAFSCYSDMQ